MPCPDERGHVQMSADASAAPRTTHSAVLNTAREQCGLFFFSSDIQGLKNPWGGGKEKGEQHMWGAAHTAPNWSHTPTARQALSSRITTTAAPGGPHDPR